MRRQPAWLVLLGLVLLVGNGLLTFCVGNYVWTGCRGTHYSLWEVQWRALSGNQLDLLLENEQGVDRRAPGSDNTQLVHRRIGQYQLRYVVDPGRRASAPIPPSDIKLVFSEQGKGVRHRPVEAFFGQIGVPLPDIRPGDELAEAQQRQVDQWLTETGLAPLNVLSWTEPESRQTWVLADDWDSVGVLNLDTGFRTVGRALAAPKGSRSWWFPQEGVVAFADVPIVPGLIGFPSRLEFWSYQTGKRFTVDLEPPQFRRGELVLTPSK